MLEAARERATRDYLVAVMKDVAGNVTACVARSGAHADLSAPGDRDRSVLGVLDEGAPAWTA